MSRQMIRWLGPMCLVALAMSGCVDTKTKERITLLEDTNRDLVARLNEAMMQRDQLGRDRNALDGRLLASQQEINRLREELANQPIPVDTAPGWTAVPGGAMIAIEGSVLFAPGKVALRAESLRTLDGIVSTIQGEYAGKDILVFGHTDNQPIVKSGWQDNWQLSSERALAVVRHMVSRGVSTGRLVACGCGEHRPVAPNDSGPNRARNRRVEIFAIDPQPGTGRP